MAITWRENIAIRNKYPVIPAQAGIHCTIYQASLQHYSHFHTGGNPYHPSFPRRRESTALSTRHHSNITATSTRAGIHTARHSRAGGNPLHYLPGITSTSTVISTIAKLRNIKPDTSVPRGTCRIMIRSEAPRRTPPFLSVHQYQQ